MAKARLTFPRCNHCHLRKTNIVTDTKTNSRKLCPGLIKIFKINRARKVTGIKVGQMGAAFECLTFLHITVRNIANIKRSVIFLSQQTMNVIFPGILMSKRCTFRCCAINFPACALDKQLVNVRLPSQTFRGIHSRCIVQLVGIYSITFRNRS